MRTLLKDDSVSKLVDCGARIMFEDGHRKSSTSKRILYIVSLNHFVNDGSISLVASLFPAMEVAFGLSTFNISIFVGLLYVTGFLFQPITGWASSRFEARKLLSLGISMMAVSMIIFSFSSTFLMFLILVVILGIGESFFHPVGATAISKSYSGKELDNSMGFESSFGNLGVVLAFVISAPLYLSLGWAGPFLVYSALEVFTILLTLTTLKSENSPTSRPYANPNLGNADVREENSKEEPYGAKTANKPKKISLIPIFFLVTGFILGGGSAMFVNFGNLLLYANGFGLSLSDNLIALWVLSAFFGAILSGRFTKIVKRDQLLFLSYLTAAIGTLVFAISPGYLTISIVSLLASGFSLAIAYPASYLILTDYYRSKSSAVGSAFGMFFSIEVIGGAALGFLSGYISRISSLSLSFMVTSILLFVAALLTFTWSLHHR